MPVHTVRRTGRPRPKSNYELFNCNNLNIRYWSWNYRGCWPLVDTHTRCVSPSGAADHPQAVRRTLPRGFDDRGLFHGAVFLIDWD